MAVNDDISLLNATKVDEALPLIRLCCPGSSSVTLNFLILQTKTGQYQKTSFGPLTEGVVNCSEADSSTCAALNRADCGQTTDNTCGDCNAGYFGTDDDNSACTGNLCRALNDADLMYAGCRLQRGLCRVRGCHRRVQYLC